MGYCSVTNCKNDSKRCKLFIFPANRFRRAKWLQNMGRDNWTPTSGSRICEKHFEESQFEKNRRDGWKKLKPNAVPTFFDVPKEPRKSKPRRKPLSKKLIKRRKSTTRDVPPCPEALNVEADTDAITHDVQLDIVDPLRPLSDAEADAVIHQLKEEVQKWKTKYETTVETFKSKEAEHTRQVQKLKEENQQFQRQLKESIDIYRSFAGDLDSLVKTKKPDEVLVIKIYNK